MTRMRSLKIKFFVFLLIFLLVQFVVCDATFTKKRDNETRSPSGQNVESSSNIADMKVLSKLNTSEKTREPSNNASNEKKTVLGTLTSNGSEENPANASVQNTFKTEESSGGHLGSLDAEALKRGFYVLIGLGILVVAYFVFRSFRVSNTRAQMIRKYGILAHRQDVEMRPLPLDEDDDDDTTVFDASNMSTHNTLQTSP